MSYTANWEDILGIGRSMGFLSHFWLADDLDQAVGALAEHKQHDPEPGHRELRALVEPGAADYRVLEADGGVTEPVALQAVGRGLEQGLGVLRLALYGGALLTVQHHLPGLGREPVLDQRRGPDYRDGRLEAA